MKYTRLLPVLMAATLVSSCEQAADNQLLVFLESESGIQPYQTRVIVTPDIVRFDDGKDSQSYTLYDRKSHIARVIDLQQKTVLEMHPKHIKLEPPFALNYRVKELGEMQDAPKVMGKVPMHYQDYTNDQLCFDVITIKGLMPEVVKALGEFQELLASDSAVTFNNLPADMQDPCSIARDTFAPTRYLQHGFPIHEWRKGYSRMLVDFKEHYQPDPKLFEIPQGYFTYTVQQVRDGKVDLDKHKLREPGAQAKN